MYSRVDKEVLSSQIASTSLLCSLRSSNTCLFTSRHQIQYWHITSISHYQGRIQNRHTHRTFAKWPTRGHYKDTAKQQAFVLNQNRANFIFFLRFLWYWNKYPNEFSDPEIVERLNWLKVIQIFDSTWHGLFVSTTYAYQINSAHFHLRYGFLELAKFLQQQGFNLFQDIRDSGISGKLFFWLAT